MFSKSYSSGWLGGWEGGWLENRGVKDRTQQSKIKKNKKILKKKIKQAMITFGGMAE